MTRSTLRLSLLALASCAALSASAQELVVNGGFETGNTNGWTPSVVGGPVATSSYHHSGAYAALGIFDTSMQQSIATVVGRTYLVSAWVYGVNGIGDSNPPIPAVPTESLGFGSFGFTAHATAGAWVQYSGTMVATSTSTALGVYLDGGASHGLGAPVMDDISVQAVPEPATFAVLGVGALALVRRRRGARPTA